jgi:hypothetical protein
MIVDEIGKKESAKAGAKKAAKAEAKPAAAPKAAAKVTYITFFDPYNGESQTSINYHLSIIDHQSRTLPNVC